jgi:phospholipid/cholesterol/gamma-HCH transport system permease protein
MGAPLGDITTQAGISLKQQEDRKLLVVLSGAWKLTSSLPSADELTKQIDTDQVRRITFETGELKDWDSSLLTFLIKVNQFCSQNNIQFETQDLPRGARLLLELASEVPERKGVRTELRKEFFVSLVGTKAIDCYRSINEMIAFLGEATIALSKFLVGKANFRRLDLLLLLQECGYQALPVVSLLSILLGLILGFVAAIELRMFGAQLFVADVVAIGMVRIMGAVMTGIIMAGRTGAAFAAQLGTMEVNEEIDALETFGIPPMEFLVLPRVIALVIMMPLLCVYSDVLGILGGVIVGVGMLDLGLIEYLNRTKEALSLSTFGIGIFHSVVFGVLVALSGCLRGMQSGRSASAVGYAATSAVVTGIVAIIVATAIITYICQVLGI